jgi:hypothetical protein
VATTGESYMGITSLLIAEADAARVAEGKPRAVQAVWADIPMADAYRDVTFQGGALDSGFMPLWLGLVNGLSDLPPSSLSSDPEEAATVYLEHLLGNAEFAGEKLVGASLGEEASYDGPFYRLRSPVVRASQITVPVVIQGGWWDLFQRGEPLLWESLENSRDRVLIMSPHYHITQGPPLEDPNLKQECLSVDPRRASQPMMYASETCAVSLQPAAVAFFATGRLCFLCRFDDLRLTTGVLDPLDGEALAAGVGAEDESTWPALRALPKSGCSPW